MSKANACARTLVVVWLAISVLAVTVTAEDPAVLPVVIDPIDASPDYQHEQRIREELMQPTSIDMVDTPLVDVVAYLMDAHDIQILLDAQALEDVGASADTPVIMHVKNISLASALELMLGDHDLTWVVRHGVLLITSSDRAAERLSTRMYPVGDLLAKKDDGALDYTPLLHALTTTIAPTSWNEVGGSGSVVPYNGVLVIAQTEQVHQQTEQLFNGLRRALRQESERQNAPADQAAVRHE